MASLPEICCRTWKVNGVTSNETATLLEPSRKKQLLSKYQVSISQHHLMQATAALHVDDTEGTIILLLAVDSFCK